MKIGFVAKSRNSVTFRRSRTKSSFPIVIASKLLQYGCCNFVGVLNTTDWPICALNVGLKNICGFCGLGGRPKGNRQIPIWGLEKMELGEIQASSILRFGGLSGRPAIPRRPVHGTVHEKISLVGSGFEKSRFLAVLDRELQSGSF